MKTTEAAERALDIINNLGGTAEQFRKNWLTIHAFSSEFDCGDIRSSLVNAVSSSISDKSAQAILTSLSSEIAYLKSNPVGNLQFSSSDTRFYRNAKQDIAQATLQCRGAPNRLGHLVCVVYQVRCNTEHGRKKLGTARSQELFRVCNRIMEFVIPELVASSGSKQQ